MFCSFPWILRIFFFTHRSVSNWLFLSLSERGVQASLSLDAFLTNLKMNQSYSVLKQNTLFSWYIFYLGIFPSENTNFRYTLCSITEFSSVLLAFTSLAFNSPNSEHSGLALDHNTVEWAHCFCWSFCHTLNTYWLLSIAKEEHF